jgi:hypothetical protein
MHLARQAYGELKKVQAQYRRRRSVNNKVLS